MKTALSRRSHSCVKLSPSVATGSTLQAHPAEVLAGGGDVRRDGRGRGSRGGRQGRGLRYDEGVNGGPDPGRSNARDAGRAVPAPAANLPFPIVMARRLFTAESSIVSLLSLLSNVVLIQSIMEKAKDGHIQLSLGKLDCMMQLRYWA